MPKGVEALERAVRRRYPHVEDVVAAIRSGSVVVDGRTVTNPASVVGRGCHVVIVGPVSLRGEAKLRGALTAFPVQVAHRVALDVGAAAGGFTRVLLESGAARVYAVDAGHGQLLGSLRQDPRVVNLEATNLGELNRAIVPEAVDLITIDLSYLSLAAAAPQLESVVISNAAELIALVKPMFELGLNRPPSSSEQLQEAVARARAGVNASAWRVEGIIDSPVTGARGAVEFLLYAQRKPVG